MRNVRCAAAGVLLYPSIHICAGQSEVKCWLSFALPFTWQRANDGVEFSSFFSSSTSSSPIPFPPTQFDSTSIPHHSAFLYNLFGQRISVLREYVCVCVLCVKCIIIIILYTLYLYTLPYIIVWCVRCVLYKWWFLLHQYNRHWIHTRRPFDILASDGQCTMCRAEKISVNIFFSIYISVVVVVGALFCYSWVVRSPSHPNVKMQRPILFGAAFVSS